MLRIKICLTIFFIYEIVATILLHASRACAPMFGLGFCSDVVFKYFVVCAAVPMLVFVIAMWVHEIVIARRRRHSVFYRARGAAMRIASNVRDRITRNISQQDLEKMIAAALIVGIKKYAARNANVRRFMDDVTASEYMDDDDEYAADDTDDAHDVTPAPRSRATTSERSRRDRPRTRKK